MVHGALGARPGVYGSRSTRWPGQMGTSWHEARAALAPSLVARFAHRRSPRAAHQLLLLAEAHRALEGTPTQARRGLSPYIDCITCVARLTWSASSPSSGLVPAAHALLPFPSLCRRARERAWPQLPPRPRPRRLRSAAVTLVLRPSGRAGGRKRVPSSYCATRPDPEHDGSTRTCVTSANCSHGTLSGRAPAARHGLASHRIAWPGRLA